MKNSLEQCLLCKENKIFSDFLWGFPSLYSSASFLYVCCTDCKPHFLALSHEEQRPIVGRALNYLYKPGQVVYTLHESDSHQIRYVGRTYNPKKRFYQHKQHAWSFSISEARRGAVLHEGHYHGPIVYRDPPIQPVHYTEGAWLYDLKLRDAEPVMWIVEQVPESPLIVERETLWTAHYIQQGADLVNLCRYNPEFMAAIRPNVDYLHDEIPLEELVFLSTCLWNDPLTIPFIREWYMYDYVK